MNSFLRTIPVMVAGLLLLGAAGSEGASPSSPYRRYNSNAFIHGNFGSLKPFFQKQWKATPQKDSQGKEGEGPSFSPLRLPLSVSSFRTGGHPPIMPTKIADGVRELEPAHRKALEDSLLQLLKGYEQLLDQQDQQQLRENLAGAFNYLFMSSVYALRNGQELSSIQQRSMLEQINAAIAMGLKERRQSDREKQELYESVVLSGSIIVGLYNEGQLKEARELATTLLDQMMGINIAKVRLEETGVRID